MAYRRSRILYVALEADIFSRLETSVNADTVATELGWSPRGTRMLLDGLVALELVTQTNGQYRNAPITSQCLVPDGPHFQGHIIRHLLGSYDTYVQLEEAIRTGEPVSPGTTSRTSGELRDFILGMADLGRPIAQAILDTVDLSPYHHVLDLAGGPGAFSIAFLERHSAMRATLMDRPDVVAIAREQTDHAGLTNRFAFLEGNVLRDNLGAGYDLLLVSNLIHVYDEPTNRALFKRCHAALEPGGLLVINDFLVENDRSGPPDALLFALHMLIHTSTYGDTYTFDQVAAWTSEAGFINGRAVRQTLGPRLWLASR
jgi:ubiquinone/menaquinone biosynthesis C-methylase UbiE